MPSMWYRLGGMKDPLGRQHLPRLSRTAQSSGQVGHTSNRGIVEASFKPDPPQGGKALSDPDAQRQIVVAPAPPFGEDPDAVAHGHGHPDGSLGCIIYRQRIVEEDHQTVTGEALQSSAVGEDELPQCPVVLVQHAHDLLGLARLGERCEPAKIAEDNYADADADAVMTTVAESARRLCRCQGQAGPGREHLCSTSPAP